MTFGSTFGRVFSPTFQPKSQASGRNTWWDLNGAITSCVVAYQPKGAASLSASYSNLANPGTYDAAPGSAPSWDSTNGWMFNGSTYLKTGFTPADATFSVIVSYSDVPNTGTQRSLLGYRVTVGGSGNLEIKPDHSGKVHYIHSDVIASLQISPYLLSGVLAIAGSTAYRNGVAESGTTQPDRLTKTLEIYIGGRNADGTCTTKIAANIKAVAFYSAILSAAQIAALTTDMAAL